MLDERNGFMPDKERVVAAEPVSTALPAVVIDALLNVDDVEAWELECAVGLDDVKGSSAKCNLR